MTPHTWSWLRGWAYRSQASTAVSERLPKRRGLSWRESASGIRGRPSTDAVGMSYRTSIVAALSILLISFSALVGQSARNEVPRHVLQQAATDFQAGKVSVAERE